MFIGKKGLTTPENQKQVALFTNAGKVGVDIFVARLQNKLCPYKSSYIQLTPKLSLNDTEESEIRELGKN